MAMYYDGCVDMDGGQGDEHYACVLSCHVGRESRPRTHRHPSCIKNQHSTHHTRLGSTIVERQVEDGQVGGTDPLICMSGLQATRSVGVVILLDSLLTLFDE